MLKDNKERLLNTSEGREPICLSTQCRSLIWGLEKEQNLQCTQTFYMLHCQGKAHKQYEFGNKVGLITTSKAQIATAIKSFDANPHDGKTIESLLDQMKNNINYLPKEVIYDRGKKVKSKLATKISTPDYRPLKRDTEYQKRKKFRRRAAIELVIGYLKSDFRMGQNYLHDSDSSQNNAFLAATPSNLKKDDELNTRSQISFCSFSQKGVSILFSKQNQLFKEQLSIERLLMS